MRCLGEEPDEGLYPNGESRRQKFEVLRLSAETGGTQGRFAERNERSPRTDSAPERFDGHEEGGGPAPHALPAPVRSIQPVRRFAKVNALRHIQSPIGAVSPASLSLPVRPRESSNSPSGSTSSTSTSNWLRVALPVVGFTA